MEMQTAKIFKNGQSQAVRIPKEYRFEGDEVLIHKEGDSVILSPKPSSWHNFFESALLPSDDFMEKRADTLPQPRDLF